MGEVYERRRFGCTRAAGRGARALCGGWRGGGGPEGAKGPAGPGVTPAQVGALTSLTGLFLANNQFGRPYFSRQGDDVTIEEANLHIINGLGATNGYPTNPFSIDPTLTVVN